MPPTAAKEPAVAAAPVDADVEALVVAEAPEAAGEEEVATSRVDEAEEDGAAVALAELLDLDFVL